MGKKTQWVKGNGEADKKAKKTAKRMPRPCIGIPTGISERSTPHRMQTVGGGKGRTWEEDQSCVEQYGLVVANAKG